jgi:hypothetical protein
MELIVHVSVSWEAEMGGLWFEISQPRPKKKKKLAEPISKNKLSMVVHIHNPSYSGGEGRKITVPSQPRQNFKTLSEK